MIINIYEPRDGWILQNIIDSIKENIDDSITVRSNYYKDKKVYPDGINFFCNMGIYQMYLKKNKVKPSIRDVVRTTHIEKWNPWNFFYKRPYYFPITQIAHSSYWFNWFKGQGINPIGIAIPGIDDNFFKINPSITKKDKPTIGIIGRLYRSGRKGEKWLRPLLKKVGADFDWIIIGKRWDLLLKFPFFRKYNIQYCKSYSKQEYYKIFEDIDIYLSLSSIEGGPMPLLESMAASIVPVVSDTGFTRDLIDHEKNGFIYPVGDMNALSKILKKLQTADLTNYKILAKEAAKPYTWKNFTDKIIGYLKQVNDTFK